MRNICGSKVGSNFVLDRFKYTTALYSFEPARTREMKRTQRRLPVTAPKIATLLISYCIQVSQVMLTCDATGPLGDWSGTKLCQTLPLHSSSSMPVSDAIDNSSIESGCLSFPAPTTQCYPVSSPFIGVGHISSVSTLLS